MLLTHSITYKGQILEISVYYTPLTNTVTEIKSIWVHAFGKKLPASDILIHMFGPQIDAIVNGADWREIYRATMACEFDGEETNGVNMNNINPHMANFIWPHV
jgi:hypothetical protein